MSSKREREYARRRYEKWQSKLAERTARRRRRRRALAVAGSAVTVVVLVLGVVWFTSRDKGTDTASPTPSATPTPSASASASTDAANPCGKPPAPGAGRTYSAVPAESVGGGKAWDLTLSTSCGDITVRLDGRKAPKAVSVIVQLAKDGYFDKTPCHRLVTAGIYVLQCGDPKGDGTGGPGFDFGPVENAPKGDLYKAGTVAMARRGGDGTSMGSQFFLVYRDSTIPSDAAGGYTVLGDITDGLKVVQKVADGGVEGGGQDGAPTRAVSILSTTVAAG